jgi:hypothetical protein
MYKILKRSDEVIILWNYFVNILKLILYNPIDYYIASIQNVRDIILTRDKSLNYFMDGNYDSLKIKMETYKKV